ncbi:MAG: phosphocholine cytidylyltransferase family protein [Elusimicrobia bacterium]|nr:phosphocholine cytidylyltransferase family protein [Elusimicrobiota bacterium]
MVLLAAGMGKRLQPVTRDLPKCMTPLHGRPLVHWQMAAARRAGLSEFTLVGGYRADRLAGLGAPVLVNPDYETTNMVESLWCARERLEEDVLVSYSDILCSPGLLSAAAGAAHDISVAVDMRWRAYWEQRFPDPLSDAESLSLEPDGRIRSIGQKVKDLDGIEAQFIGLIALSRRGARTLLDRYEAERGSADRDGRRMFMTDLLQGAVSDGVAVHAVPFPGGWLEVDSLSDLELGRRLTRPQEDMLEVLR